MLHSGTTYGPNRPATAAVQCVLSVKLRKGRLLLMRGLTLLGSRNPANRYPPDFSGESRLADADAVLFQNLVSRPGTPVAPPRVKYNRVDGNH